MITDIQNEKAYLGFTYGGAEQPNNHRWFVHFYSGERIHSTISTDKVFIKTGNIKCGSATWSETMRNGNMNQHGRITFPNNAIIKMVGGYDNVCYVGSSEEIPLFGSIKEENFLVDPTKNLGFIKYNRNKNKWDLIMQPLNEKRFEVTCQTLILEKERVYVTERTDEQTPKVALAYNFDNLSDIEVLGDTVIL